MPLRLLAAVLALSVLGCAGSPLPAPETPAPAIDHFFGQEKAAAVEEQPAVEPAPAVKEPAPVVEKAEKPAPAANSAHGGGPDAIEHFFGAEAVQKETGPAPEAKPEEASQPADAFQYFFGEKEKDEPKTKPPV
ncbi:MAG TPA: hypothetical protein VEW48_03770 [Thermoanaerobaculia bacterium]|nr:hypothetical protein [Thermoanaerobaculia bacterium]